MEKKGLLEKIQYYINAEENCLDSEIRVAKKSKNIIHSFNLDEIFWPEENNLEEYKPEHISHEKDFWNENKDLLYDLLEKNQITNSDFLILKDAITIIRWKYFMDDNYQTIDKEYQDMCKFFVKLQLKYNDIWILNFLRYINHESWYYKRVKALTLFRLLSNPKQEIIWVRDEICSFLYDSIKVEPDSYEIAQNILKEYIEKVFTIACTTYDSRIEFISGWDNNWNIRCWNNEFVDWLRKYINWEKIDSETISIEDYNDEEITVTDMIGRDVSLNIDKIERIVCIGAGALRLYSYIGDMNLIVGAEDIDRNQDDTDYSLFGAGGFKDVSRPYYDINKDLLKNTLLTSIFGFFSEVILNTFYFINDKNLILSTIFTIIIFVATLFLNWKQLDNKDFSDSTASLGGDINN